MSVETGMRLRGGTVCMGSTAERVARDQQARAVERAIQDIEGSFARADRALAGAREDLAELEASKAKSPVCLMQQQRSERLENLARLQGAIQRRPLDKAKLPTTVPEEEESIIS